MSLINISDLTFCYDGSYDNIFENVSFQIDTDWRLGLIGRNGRGKTIFLHLLEGGLEFSGNIHSDVTFDYFPFKIKNNNKNSIDIAAEIIPDFELWELERELSVLDVNTNVLYRPFDTLSSGEQTKLLLACLFLKKNNFLLIDEPTNHLDIPGRKIVSSYLKSKKGFIIISHDRLFLDNCIDHILSINKSNIEIQKGNFSTWKFNKERQDSYELAENERLKKNIEKLSAAAMRTSAWSDRIEKNKNGMLISGIKADKGYLGHKSEKMMRRSKSIEKRQNEAIQTKAGLLKNLEHSDKLVINSLTYHKNKLAEVKNLTVFYSDKIIAENISFDINEGDRIALIGKNGSGKSTILKLLSGHNISYSGLCKTGSNLKVSYVPQDSSFLSGGLKEFAEQENIDESLFKAILRKLDFNRIQFEKDMSEFSAGQKKKVLLARSLCESAHLYIWDEPLNFIDIISRIQIEELILNSKPTMIFVEHDSLFCENIATKSVIL